MKDIIKIPTEEECFKIMNQYKMPEHIIEHSKQVRNVSYALAENLKTPSIINKSLVTASALLHDIAKALSIETGEMRHDLIGGKILRNLGYETIAYIVETHVVFGNFNESGNLEERELVYYSDKRVMHDKIVSIDTRIDDLVKRYGINEIVINLITENKNFIHKLGKKIQGFLKDDIEGILSKL